MQGFLEKVLGVFGGSEDQDHDLERVPFYSRPMGASTQDRWTGKVSESGDRIYEGTGGEYSVRDDPDQRTTRTRVTEAVEGFADNPRLPTREEVKDVAVGAAQGAWDAVSIPGDLASGDRSAMDVQMGDAMGLAPAMGAAALPFKKPDGAVGMFMRADRNPAMKERLSEAQFAALEGKSPEEIWEQTGIFDLGDGEWFYEIDDSQSKIAMTQPPATATKRSADNEITVNAEFQKRASEILARVQKGEISKDEARRLSLELQKERSERMSGATDEPAEKRLKQRGRLEEVLDHPEIMERYPDLAELTAQAGVGTSPSGWSTRGSHYDNDAPESTLPNGVSHINSFKSAAEKNPAAGLPGGGEGVWSTLLHEVQHAVQQREGHKGTGSNQNRAEQRALEANKRYYQQVEDYRKSEKYLEVSDIMSGIREQVQGKSYVSDDDLADISFARKAAQEYSPDDQVGSIAKSMRHIFTDATPAQLKEMAARIVKEPRIDEVEDEIDKIRNGVDGRLMGMETHEVYRRNKGEAVSRLTQARRNFPEETRRSVYPLENLDVPKEELWDNE